MSSLYPERGRPWGNVAGFTILHECSWHPLGWLTEWCLFHKTCGSSCLWKHKWFPVILTLKGCSSPAVPSPSPQVNRSILRNHCLKLSLTSSSPATGKPKNTDDALASPQRGAGAGTSASEVTELNDPCPEAREKLQEMCRIMWAPQRLGQVGKEGMACVCGRGILGVLATRCPQRQWRGDCRPSHAHP